MQDKDFDQLFKDRFEEAEVSPSADLWGKIEAGMEPGKKRSLPLYWLSAAAVAGIAVAVGLLIPSSETIKLQGSNAAVTENVSGPSIATPVEPAIPTDNEQAYTSTPLIIAPRTNADEIKNNSVAVQPRSVDVHPVNMEPDIQQPIQSQVVQEQTEPQSETVIASADVTPDVEGFNDQDQVERKGIKNVGDIINYVVEKVDKRERKFIRFNTDDDNSSLVAINIGILKFNKKDK